MPVNEPSVLSVLSADARFLVEQRTGHQCMDCGYAYLQQSDVDGADFCRRVIGGGTIVASTREPIRELHILPHGGTELPTDLLSGIDSERFSDLSRLVHKNSDMGTGAMYRELADWVMSGQAPGVAVAGFHLSRLLLDANRVHLNDQIPARPYVGDPELYADYLSQSGRDLRDGALLPWVEEVNKILRSLPDDAVIYHHHTLDVYSLSPRPYDVAAAQARPAFQLTWKKPTIDDRFDDLDTRHAEGMAPLEDLEKVREKIGAFLGEIGVTDSVGHIDYPLYLPVSPFYGTRDGDYSVGPKHVLYDLRKKILTSSELIHSWIHTGPWKLA